MTHWFIGYSWCFIILLSFSLKFHLRFTLGWEVIGDNLISAIVPPPTLSEHVTRNHWQELGYQFSWIFIVCKIFFKRVVSLFSVKKTHISFLLFICWFIWWTCVTQTNIFEYCYCPLNQQLVSQVLLPFQLLPYSSLALARFNGML